MPLRRSLLRHRIIAIVAALAMVAVICGFTAHGFASHGNAADHCDWTMHFTGVAGAAPKPVPIARPILAAWLLPATVPPAPRSARRLPVHLPRGPPTQLLSDLDAA